MLTIIEVKVKASPLVAKSVLDIEFWSQAYILDICIIFISSDDASLFITYIFYAFLDMVRDKLEFLGCYSTAEIFSEDSYFQYIQNEIY